MKTLWKILKQRYADMGNLLFAILIVMASVVAYISPTVIRLVLAGGPERMLGGVYACNLFVILVVCVNMLRMDCRKLISNKTSRPSGEYRFLYDIFYANPYLFFQESR